MPDNLLDCGHVPSPHSDFTTGYGIDSDGKKHCYECCAARDRANMIATGRATLYLTGNKVTNWPGSLTFHLWHKPKKGHHNIAGIRYDVWFKANGENWHGTQYGDNTQILHCKRVKGNR